jgi:hypothetical protein
MASPKPTPKPKVMAKPTPKVKYTPKPKATPVPKFTAPTVAQYKKSAAYKTDSMSYKEYIDAIYDVYKYNLKKGK